MNQFIQRLHRRLSLRWKIYSSLAAILIPVSLLVMAIQTAVTRPLLEEEVKMLGFSILRSLASDIKSMKLLQKQRLLEEQLIEIAWSQPSIVRLDVFALEGSMLKLTATNLSDDAPIDYTTLNLDEAPRSYLRNDVSPSYWEITYPIKDRQNKTIGHIRMEISLNIVRQVVSTFSKVTVLGTVLSTLLLILLLSYYLRRMIENERRLRMAESANIFLNDQLSNLQRELHLKDKLALMGQLTASFAHEIGTPLNSLSGHVQLLKEELTEPQPSTRLEIINSQISRIESIVKDFLQSTHAPPQQKQLVNLRELLERMKQLIGPRLQQLNAHCSVETPQELGLVRLVPSDLEQVLLNLANNALDSIEAKLQRLGASYFAPTLQFTVVILSDHYWLQVKVADNGEGIPPEELKNVLKPFYTTKAPGQGTGLGLTICQRLIKKAGGRIDIESELGKGTRILVTIPYDDA